MGFKYERKAYLMNKAFRNIVFFVCILIHGVEFTGIVSRAGAEINPYEGVIEAQCEKVSIKMFGHIFAFGAPSDFEKNVILQEGNTSPSGT